MELTPMQPIAPPLFELPLARSRWGLPPAYEKAHAAFESAQHDYQAGKHAQAAPKFMAVADLLKAPKEETTYSAAFAKMRAAAYQDAAIAYGFSGRAMDGKKALERASDLDADNASLLRSLAKGLK
ncbi:MAG: hypothetical protein QM723_34600 [Myxococcaceae bacterium]